MFNFGGAAGVNDHPTISLSYLKSLDVTAVVMAFVKGVKSMVVVAGVIVEVKQYQGGLIIRW